MSLYMCMCVCVLYMYVYVYSFTYMHVYSCIGMYMNHSIHARVSLSGLPFIHIVVVIDQLLWL